MPPPCKACLYIASNPRCDAEKQKGRKVPIAAIHRQYPEIPYKTWCNHFKKRHMVNKQKEAKIVDNLIKEAIDLKKWAEEIHDLSIKAGKIAIGEIKDPVIPPDLRSFGSCMAPITKVFDCMTRKSENNENNDKDLLDKIVGSLETHAISTQTGRCLPGLPED